jgi:cytidylate kinase
MKNTVITIDGHSGCGKSTLAKSLAKKIELLIH